MIAEPGGTAEGSPTAFLNLISLAAKVGCNVFKNQWVSDPDQLCERRRAPAYRDAYAKIAYPLELHRLLAAETRARGMAYACSVYLPEDVKTVAPFCDYLKCSSFEQTDQDLMWELAHAGPPVIVSLGMGGVALPRLNLLVDGRYFRLTRLACVSAYPAPDDQMNLARIREDDLDGLSDHSKHPWTGALAVAAGARFIEFHLRLDDADPANADYAVARTPEEARVYVENIRQAERMLGDGVRRMQDAEKAMAPYRVGR